MSYTGASAYYKLVAIQFSLFKSFLVYSLCIKSEHLEKNWKYVAQCSLEVWSTLLSGKKRNFKFKLKLLTLTVQPKI